MFCVQVPREHHVNVLAIGDTTAGMTVFIIIKMSCKTFRMDVGVSMGMNRLHEFECCDIHKMVCRFRMWITWPDPFFDPVVIPMHIFAKLHQIFNWFDQNVELLLICLHLLAEISRDSPPPPRLVSRAFRIVYGIRTQFRQPQSIAIETEN